MQKSNADRSQGGCRDLGPLPVVCTTPPPWGRGRGRELCVATNKKLGAIAGSSAGGTARGREGLPMLPPHEAASPQARIGDGSVVCVLPWPVPLVCGGRAARGPGRIRIWTGLGGREFTECGVAIFFSRTSSPSPPPYPARVFHPWHTRNIQSNNHLPSPWSRSFPFRSPFSLSLISLPLVPPIPPLLLASFSCPVELSSVSWLASRSRPSPPFPPPSSPLSRGTTTLSPDNSGPSPRRPKPSGPARPPAPPLRTFPQLPLRRVPHCRSFSLDPSFTRQRPSSRSE